MTNGQSNPTKDRIAPARESFSRLQSENVFVLTVFYSLLVVLVVFSIVFCIVFYIVILHCILL